MSRPRLYLRHPDACTGCGICELVCSGQHEPGTVNPAHSRIRININPETGRIIPLMCRFCTHPACVTACPVEALSQNTNTGMIEVDETTCDGCGRCVEACKFNGIYVHPAIKRAISCDLCDGDPQCVKYCMKDALVYCTSEEYKKSRKISVHSSSVSTENAEKTEL